QRHSEWLDLTVKGSGFVAGALIGLNDHFSAAKFSAADEIYTIFPNEPGARRDVALVRVHNPAPGGGVSLNALPFFITEAPVTVPASTTDRDAARSLAPGGGTVSLRATGQAGTGRIALGEYGGDPSGTGPTGGQYFHVHLFPGHTFSGLSVVKCSVLAGQTLRWFNGSTWAAVSPAALSYD